MRKKARRESQLTAFHVLRKPRPLLMLGGLARNATLLEISTDGQWSAWKKLKKSVVMRQSFHLFLTTLTMLISYCPIPLQMPGKLKCTSHRHWLVGLRGGIARHHRSDIGRPFFRFKRRLVVLHIPHRRKPVDKDQPRPVRSKSFVEQPGPRRPGVSTPGFALV